MMSDACNRVTLPGRPAFRPCVFLVLTVMTLSYALYRHDAMFHVEHSFQPGIHLFPDCGWAITPSLRVEEGPAFVATPEIGEDDHTSNRCVRAPQ